MRPERDRETDTETEIERQRERTQTLTDRGLLRLTSYILVIQGPYVFTSLTADSQPVIAVGHYELHGAARAACSHCEHSLTAHFSQVTY